MICLIPARGGSKRIPLKNIKPFLGTPIIHYPIDAAWKSRLFGLLDIYVYTDSIEIYQSVAVVARRREVPDEQTTAEMLSEFIRMYNPQDEYILIVYPCAVFVTPELIKGLPLGHDCVMTETRDGNDAGQLYLINVARFKEQREIYMSDTLRIPIDAVDINTPEDWSRAEELYGKLLER